MGQYEVVIIHIHLGGNLRVLWFFFSKVVDLVTGHVGFVPGTILWSLPYVPDGVLAQFRAVTAWNYSVCFFFPLFFPFPFLFLFVYVSFSCSFNLIALKWLVGVERGLLSFVQCK
jgi:hypothetical protein